LKFAVHWPGNPVASPRSHDVPRRDIPGRVHISVEREPADSALEVSLALARLPVHLSARRAALACVMRLNFLHSAWSFLLEAAYQQAPSGPEDFTVEPGLLAHIPAGIAPCSSCGPGHILDHEGFDPDQVVPAGNVCAGLFGPILAPVCLANAQPGDSTLHPLAAFRASPGTDEFALQATQPLPLPSGQARYSQQLTCRQRSGYRYTSVDSDNFSVARGWDGIGDGREGDMPASGPVHGHPVGPRTRRYRTGPAETYPSHLRNPDFARFPVEPTHMLRLERDNSESLISPSFAPGRPACRVRRVEEGDHRVGEVPQGLLLNHLGARSQPAILGAKGGELATLHEVARSARPARAPVRMLLHREIPHIPGVRAVPSQKRFLSRRGKQAVSGHTNTLATTADNSREVKRRFVPATKAEADTSRIL
jgi:hypothetical protein